MKVSVLAACVVLVLLVRPGFGADDQSQVLRSKQSASSQTKAAPSVTSKKESTAKSKPGSKAKNTLRPEEEPKENSVGLPLLKNIARDQRAIWTSPSRLRFRDVTWLVPLAGVTAGLMGTDRDVSRHFSNSPDTLKRYRRLSDAGALSLVGAAGGLYLWGKATHDDHKRETGLLSGEALVNSLMLTSAIQYSAGRERPFRNGAEGDFFQRGTSFPSNHSAAAWSVASVIAHEYPGPLTKVLAYGLASAVSFSRVKSKQHFPSDVVVGGLLGWFVGKQVYREHHDTGLGGASWETFSEARGPESGRQAADMGSTFVPLESWVYQGFERLAAMGYVTTAMLGLKPWTRLECARLAEEASEALSQDAQKERGPTDEAVRLNNALRQEFAWELGLRGGGANRSLHLESMYSRVTSISGPPLTDGFHFGQTISYDFGRPSRRGMNAIAGAAFRGTSGPLAFYVRAEYQHAPGAPPLSSAVLNTISLRDFTPLGSAQPFPAINRVRLLDAYASMNFHDWQFSVGNQSLSWGPGPGGSLLLSNNAEPFPMVRLTRVVPVRLPSILGWFGPVRGEFFVGHLRGKSFVTNTSLYGTKLSFRPAPFFEFSYGRTTTLGGVSPLTARNFVRSYFGLTNPKPVDSVPGDTRTSVDWTFRIPGLRNRVVLYGELEDDDDPIPLQNLRKSLWRPGLYITRLPGLPRMDFHIEGPYAESSFDQNHRASFNYWNFEYTEGYTNRGFLMANTVGRLGRAIQCWIDYWFSPRHSLQFSYKHSSVSSDFIPGGGRWEDYSVRHELYMRSGVYVKSAFQFEHIGQYPNLFSGRVNNVTASLELGFTREPRLP